MTQTTWESWDPHLWQHIFSAGLLLWMHMVSYHCKPLSSKYPLLPCSWQCSPPSCPCNLHFGKMYPKLKIACALIIHDSHAREALGQEIVSSERAHSHCEEHNPTPTLTFPLCARFRLQCSKDLGGVHSTTCFLLSTTNGHAGFITISSTGRAFCIAKGTLYPVSPSCSEIMAEHTIWSDNCFWAINHPCMSWMTSNQKCYSIVLCSGCLMHVAWSDEHQISPKVVVGSVMQPATSSLSPPVLSSAPEFRLSSQRLGCFLKAR